jgi:hypothetical protein
VGRLRVNAVSYIATLKVPWMRGVVVPVTDKQVNESLMLIVK